MHDDPATATRLLERRRNTELKGEAARQARRRMLPPDLLRDAAGRLRAACLLFAFTFAMANFISPLFTDRLADILAHPDGWLPGAISIALALGVFATSRHRRLTPTRVMDIGLVFGVIGSYGIAAAQYPHLFREGLLTRDSLWLMGLSWVAPWMIIMPILVPNTPLRTLAAALASSTAVPVTIILSRPLAEPSPDVPPGFFFAGAVLPYLLCALLAYFSARIINKLGRDVTHAREMGSYQLVELIGRGGMGEVWRARHRMLVRPAAIKTVRPEKVGERDERGALTTIGRFEREAQATAALCSPHTVQLFDYGVAEDGSLYYVMELLDGVDAETLVHRFGPLEAARVVHLLLQICDSLAEAHASGLIHRDIKPANVFICRYGRQVDFVKVLDFGMVKQAGGRRPGDPRLTAADVAGGTPAFMAPEQALGDRSVDARTDLYAVGCVAYWLLTGQLVFEADTAMQVITHHVQSPPDPPSTRTELPIPEPLERAVMACLEKDPDRRPHGADELAALLAGIDRIEPWTAERARRWWETHLPA